MSSQIVECSQSQEGVVDWMESSDEQQIGQQIDIALYGGRGDLERGG